MIRPASPPSDDFVLEVGRRARLCGRRGHAACAGRFSASSAKAALVLHASPRCATSFRQLRGCGRLWPPRLAGRGFPTRDPGPPPAAREVPPALIPDHSRKGGRMVHPCRHPSYDPQDLRPLINSGLMRWATARCCPVLFRTPAPRSGASARHSPDGWVRIPSRPRISCPCAGAVTPSSSQASCERGRSASRLTESREYFL